MNIEEMVNGFIADFERNRSYGAKYIWSEAYDRALAEREPARRRKSIDVAKTILVGRRQQLREFVVDDPEAKAELAALNVAIERLSVL